MEYILKFRSPYLHLVITVTKRRNGFLKKKENVRGFFVFMTMLSFRQLESN